MFDANAGYLNRTTFMYGQPETASEAISAIDTFEVMNEAELAAINEKWKAMQTNGAANGDHEKLNETQHVADIEELQEEEIMHRSNCHPAGWIITVSEQRPSSRRVWAYPPFGA